MIRRLLAVIFASLLLTACATTSVPGTVSRQGAHTVTVGIAAINDFHGSLEPPHQSVVAPDGKGGFLSVPAGGAAWLASAIDSVRAKYPNHLTVSAGDMIGASQISSSFYLDEPAIGVMNRLGIDFNAVGNHEFDGGVDELLRMKNGGCEQHTAIKPCQIEKYRGANFPFLAANVSRPDGSALFPASALRTFGKGRGQVKVAIIGMTLKGTGGLMKPEYASAVRFADEADTANQLVGSLKAQGADAIILLIHQGGRTNGDPNPDTCPGLYGDIKAVLDRLDTRIDVVVSGHTHWDYVCEYGQYNPAKPFLLTSAGLWGKLVTDITLEIDPVQHKVLSRKAHNVIVQSPGYGASLTHIDNTDLYPRFEPRADIAAYVAQYAAAANVVASRKVGQLAAPVDKIDGPLANSGGPLGNLIADAQLAATAGAGAQIAFMNPFGIRRSLNAAPDHTVTFADVYAVQPFRNKLTTISLTGADIKAVIEEGFDVEAPEQILAGSQGFSFSYDRSQPIGSRIVAITLNGAPLEMSKTYRVTVSQFLADGGDSFHSFTKGRDPVPGMLETEALEAWLKALPPRAAPSEVRAIDVRPDLNPLKRNAPPGQKYRR
ncbi:MAG: bifunctional metallophosphatase/5'-nucleotidase [Novosphingobium sp.]